MVVGCSSDPSEPGQSTPDSGQVATCAAGTSCSCGDGVTCGPNEYCQSVFEIGQPTTRKCVKWVEAARCADLPCADSERCSKITINDVPGVVCHPRPALGEACVSSGDVDYDPCQAGSFCHLDFGSGRDWQCTALAAAGASCETYSKFACPTGQTCQSTIFPEFKCLRARKAGESCLNSTDCDFGLYCASDEKCQPRKGVGSPCKGDTAGALGGECARFLRCNAGTCQPE